MAGFISLIFLYVFIKIIQALNGYYEEDDPAPKKIDLPSFQSGMSQGLFLIQMGIYKMWVDGGETVIVGSFDNVQAEIQQNISQFMQDNTKLIEWNQKLLKYAETKKDTPK